MLHLITGILVQEVKYERVYPTLDAADYATAKQFNFVVSPSTEYFTRYIHHLFIGLNPIGSSRNRHSIIFSPLSRRIDVVGCLCILSPRA